MASCPAFVEDSCQNRALRKRFAAAASFSFERGKERLDTFPQLIRHITKICLFHGTRLPHLLKSKNMPDILLILDFSGLEAAFADGMVPLCSYVRYIKEEYNVSIEYVAPNSLRLNRIFVNANWAHLIDSTARESKYSGYKQFPATIVNDDDDLSSVVNSVLDCVLRATDLKCREDLGVIEWVINEIAENILRHSESTVGGLVHLSRFIQNKKCIEIVFSDSGIGIAESLKSVPKYSTASDCELLELATREGITNGKGMGNGLYGARSVSVQSNGYFKIYSNHGKLEIGNKGTPYTQMTPMVIPFHETAICIALDFSTPGVLESALNFNDERYRYVSVYTEVLYDDEDTIFEIKKEVASLSTRSIGASFRRKVVNLIEMQNPDYITFDFDGIDSTMSSSFADEVFGKIIEEKGKKFISKIRMKNISEVNKNLIQRAIVQRLERQPL